MVEPNINGSAASVHRFFKDLGIIAKLFLFAIYSSLKVLVKNIFIPTRFLEKSICNQVIVITGAAGGIGENLVKNMLVKGSRVVCLDISKKSLDRLEASLSEEERQRATFHQIDVTKTEEITQVFEIIQRDIGPVDVLINNAGIFNKGKLFVELSEQEMRNIFDVNIMAQMFMCRQFLPDMIQRRKGHIVNMSSSLGLFGAFRVSDYSASKFAVAGFTEALRIEMKSMNSGIRVSLVCPYHVDTELFKGFDMNKFKWASVCKNDPLKVASSITKGILQEKEFIGYPIVQSYIFLAIKNLLTTTTTDLMLIWFGFNDGIIKSNNTFKAEETVLYH